MIIRVLGEGQYDVEDGAVEALQPLDEELEAAVESADEQRFRAALTSLLERIRAVGKPLPDEEIDASDAILPGPDARIEEVQAILLDDGVIPG